MKYLGSNIKYLLRTHGLRNKELAEHFGWNPQVLSSYSTGAATPPLKNILLLSEYFKVTVDDLLTQDLRGGAAPSVKAEDCEKETDAALVQLARKLVQIDEKATTLEELVEGLRELYPAAVKKLEKELRGKK